MRDSQAGRHRLPQRRRRRWLLGSSRPKIAHVGRMWPPAPPACMVVPPAQLHCTSCMLHGGGHPAVCPFVQPCLPGRKDSVCLLPASGVLAAVAAQRAARSPPAARLPQRSSAALLKTPWPVLPGRATLQTPPLRTRQRTMGYAGARRWPPVPTAAAEGTAQRPRAAGEGQTDRGPPRPPWPRPAQRQDAGSSTRAGWRARGGAAAATAALCAGTRLPPVSCASAVRSCPTESARCLPLPPCLRFHFF